MERENEVRESVTQEDSMFFQEEGRAWLLGPQPTNLGPGRPARIRGAAPGLSPFPGSQSPFLLPVGLAPGCLGHGAFLPENDPLPRGSITAPQGLSKSLGITIRIPLEESEGLARRGAEAGRI